MPPSMHANPRYVPPITLCRPVRYLRSLQRLAPARPTQTVALSRVVAVTFDDGYVDFAELAWPVLRRHDATATVFVVTDYVGKTARWLPFPDERARPLLGWHELEDLAAQAAEIGSHTCRHLELDAIEPKLAREEIERSRREIGDRVAIPACFAYPFGYHNLTVRSLAASAGYVAACEVGRGLCQLYADRMALRRLLIQPTDEPEVLVRRLAGPEQLPGDRLRELARPVWRAARRARRPIRSLELAGPFHQV